MVSCLVDWGRLQSEAIKRHEEEWEDLVQKYKKNGDGDEVAKVKAGNTLVPYFRKELREVVFEHLKWMHNLKKTTIYKKLMETKRNLINMED